MRIRNKSTPREEVEDEVGKRLTKRKNKTKKPNKNKIMNTKNPQTQKQGHQTDQKQ